MGGKYVKFPPQTPPEWGGNNLQKSVSPPKFNGGGVKSPHFSAAEVPPIYSPPISEEPRKCPPPRWWISLCFDLRNVFRRSKCPTCRLFVDFRAFRVFSKISTRIPPLEHSPIRTKTGVHTYQPAARNAKYLPPARRMRPNVIIYTYFIISRHLVKFCDISKIYIFFYFFHIFQLFLDHPARL